MSDKSRQAHLQVSLETMSWLLTVPADFDFGGPEGDAILDMLPTVPEQRRDVA